MRVITHPFNNLESSEIKHVLIKQQGIVVYPTETFYALGCVATSAQAVEKVYHLKKRTRNSPLLILINSWEMLDCYATPITENQKDLLKQHWPGPLTAILNTQSKLAGDLNRSGTAVGFRMTSSPIAQELIRIAGVPLVGTSANLSRAFEIASFQKVKEVFGELINLYIDGGTTPGVHPSTVINMVDPNEYTVVRQGAVRL